MCVHEPPPCCFQHIKGFMQKDEFENLIRFLTGLDKVISRESPEKDEGVFDGKLWENPGVRMQSKGASNKLLNDSLIV